MRGEQGFLRGALRGLTRERRLRGVPAGEPMVLSGSADGRLSLADPATGQRLALESFGPSNAAVFARWLQAT
jgi:putative photosynthetic complex assembly protein